MPVLKVFTTLSMLKNVKHVGGAAWRGVLKRLFVAHFEVISSDVSVSARSSKKRWPPCRGAAPNPSVKHAKAAAHITPSNTPKYNVYAWVFVPTENCGVFPPATRHARTLLVVAAWFCLHRGNTSAARCTSKTNNFRRLPVSCSEGSLDYWRRRTK